MALQEVRPSCPILKPEDDAGPSHEKKSVHLRARSPSFFSTGEAHRLAPETGRPWLPNYARQGKIATGVTPWQVATFDRACGPFGRIDCVCSARDPIAD